MFNKTFLLFLFFLPIYLSKIESFPHFVSLADYSELPQYGEIKASDRSIIYMNLNGFKKGDTIYIELSFDNGYSSSDYQLELSYKETNDLNNLGTFNISKSYKFYESDYSTWYSFTFKIKLSGDYKFIAFLMPYFIDPKTKNYIKTTITVRHTKESKVGLIMAIIFICFIVIAIVVCAIWCIRRIKNRNALYIS